MAVDILTHSRLRTLCLLADDIGHSDSDLAFKIRFKPGNFSKEVMGPLRKAGYVTFSPPIRFGKPKRTQELEDAGSETFKLPQKSGRPRKMNYINYDNERILSLIIKKLTFEFKRIDFSLLESNEKIKELTKKLNEAKNGNESYTQIEKKQLDLKKARDKRDMMKRDKNLYYKAHEEFSKKFQMLQVSDDDGH